MLALNGSSEEQGRHKDSSPSQSSDEGRRDKIQENQAETRGIKRRNRSRDDSDDGKSEGQDRCQVVRWCVVLSPSRLHPKMQDCFVDSGLDLLTSKLLDFIFLLFCTWHCNFLPLQSSCLFKAVRFVSQHRRSMERRTGFESFGFPIALFFIFLAFLSSKSLLLVQVAK
jgi:hypothetical protein